MCKGAIDEIIRQKKIASGDMEAIKSLFKDSSRLGLPKQVADLAERLSYLRESQIALVAPSRSVANPSNKE